MFIWYLILICCFLGIGRQQLNVQEIVTVSVEQTVVKPGIKSFADIRVKIKQGYHIQANVVNDESLIPAKLKIHQQAYIKTGKPVFPACKLFRLEGTENDLLVFDSVFVIRLPLETASSSRQGRYLIKAELLYQACNAKTCLFPRSVNFNLPVEVKSE